MILKPVPVIENNASVGDDQKNPTNIVTSEIDQNLSDFMTLQSLDSQIIAASLKVDNYPDKKLEYPGMYRVFKTLFWKRCDFQRQVMRSRNS